MKSKAADRLKRLAEAYTDACCYCEACTVLAGRDDAKRKVDAARKALHDAIDLTVGLKAPLELDDL